MEQEGLLGALENEVGAVLEWLERWNMPITADKDVRGVLELAINSGRRHLGVNRLRGSKGVESLAEVGEKRGRWRFRDSQELPREAQRSAKNHFRGGGADTLLGGCPCPKRTQGRCWCQRLPMQRARSVFFRERWKRSTILLDSGW